MSKKYYQSNLSGAFNVLGIGDIPGAPSYLSTEDKEKQKILAKHPRNGFRVGFSEVEGPKPIVTQNADGSIKDTEKTPKDGREPQEPKGSEVSADAETEDATDGLTAADVTNAQTAKKYLLDNHGDEVDGRTLTTAPKIREAAEGLVEFPNWEVK